MGPEFASNLARSGFRRRSARIDKETVIYALADKSGSVRVPLADWLRLGDAFEACLLPKRRLVRRLTLALLPFILVFGLIFARTLPYSGVIILLLLFGSPLVLYLWYARQVQRVSAGIENTLRGYPGTTPVPPDRARTPRIVEIAAMVLVGPHLLVALVGEIGGPDTFRGTPLWGKGIGFTEVLGFIVLFTIFAWPRLVTRLRRN